MSLPARRMHVQITPAYPPAVSGVGDYAALLARAASVREGRMRTLVAAEAADGAEALRDRSADALVAALGAADRVLLHYSGYGYARWALCWWLVEGLRRWKHGAPDRRLVTLFHEVYATGPIWRTSFWTARPQRRIVQALAQLTYAGFVTSQGGYERLRPLRPDLPLEILPVFSNVGEPAEVAQLAGRAARAVVFGGPVRRERAYAAASRNTAALAAGFDRLGVEEIIDIGPGAVAAPSLAGRPVRVLGVLPPREVSAWLSDARLGLIDYPWHVMTKSGIAAAYFAHGTLAVNTNRLGRLPDDLVEGQEFVTPQVMRETSDFQEVADAGRAWYAPHGLQETVRRLGLLSG